MHIQYFGERLYNLTIHFYKTLYYQINNCPEKTIFTILYITIFIYARFKYPVDNQ